MILVGLKTLGGVSFPETDKDLKKWVLFPD